MLHECTGIQYPSWCTTYIDTVTIYYCDSYVLTVRYMVSQEGK